MPDSLPGALLQNAHGRTTQPALRYKHLGLWHTRSWGEVAEDVRCLAAALHRRGFVAADHLVVLSDACAEALVISLAAQWLGGSVRLLDPAQDHQGRLNAWSSRFVFAQGVALAQQVSKSLPSTSVQICLDNCGLGSPKRDALLSWSSLLSEGQAEVPPPKDRATSIAFSFYCDTKSRVLEQAIELTHGELLNDARRLIEAESVLPVDEALAARVFAADGQARYLLTPWLLAGFCLSFPEALSTRDNDRRELGPTLVLGTSDSFSRLAQWARERQPLPGSLHRALYDWAMAPSLDRVRRFLGYWLIRRTLLDVLGLSRLSTALLAGEALDHETAAFFATLGIEPRMLNALPARPIQGSLSVPILPQLAR